MSTEKSPHLPSFTASERRHPARPYLLTLLGILLVFGAFLLLLLYPSNRAGSPQSGGNAPGDGPGTGEYGEGPGAGDKGQERGIDGPVAGETGKGSRKGPEEEKSSATPLPVPQNSPKNAAPRGNAPDAETERQKEREVYRENITDPDAAKKGSETAENDRRTMHRFAPAGEDSLGGGSAGASGKRGFYGLKVNGNTLFIVDISGSMGGQTAEGISRINVLKNQLINAILSEHRKEKKAKYSIIAFSDKLVKFPSEPGKPQTYFTNTKNIAKMKLFCDSLSACGGTGMMLAWQEAVSLIGTKEVAIDTIFFLSDGEPTDCNMNQLSDYIRQNVGETIVIHSIAIGMDSPDMERISKEHHGTYRSIR